MICHKKKKKKIAISPTDFQNVSDQQNIELHQKIIDKE